MHSSSERFSCFSLPIPDFTARKKTSLAFSLDTFGTFVDLSNSIHSSRVMKDTVYHSHSHFWDGQQMADGRSRCAKRFPWPSLDTDSCDTPAPNGLFCTNLKNFHVTFRYFHAKLKTMGRKEGIKASASCRLFYHSSIANLCVQEIKRPR